jgi:virulence-associated protein VapD
MLMYAIAFDLDTAALKAHYGKPSTTNAYSELRDFLSPRGFTKQQGSLLYGDDSVTMVNAVLTVSAMSQQFPWLKNCVSDIRILQLLANDDLRPALV